MEFSELIYQRRSCRKFEDTEIPSSEITQILKACQQAPTSCNLQNFSFIVLNDRELLESLTQSVSPKFSYSKTMLLMTAQRGFSMKRNAIYVSAGFIADHLVLEAANRGYGSLVMAGFSRDRRIRKLLAIPRNHSIVLLIGLGICADREPKAPRIDAARSFGFNKFNPANTLMTSRNPSRWTPEDLDDYRSRISPIYASRFRLHSIPESAHRRIVARISEVVDFHAGSERVVDLHTYDGRWIHELSNYIKTPGPLPIVTLENDKYVQLVLKKRYGVRALSKTDPEFHSALETFDVATSVFQLNHLPDLEAEMRDAFNMLKPGGKVLVALHLDPVVKYAARRFKDRVWPLRYGRLGTAYEGNTFYKAGPHRRLRPAQVLHAARQVGFGRLRVEQLGPAPRFLGSRTILISASRP